VAHLCGRECVCRALSDFKTKFLKRLTLHNKNVSFAVEAEAEAFACILTFDADNEGRTTAPQKRGWERGMVCGGWWVARTSQQGHRQGFVCLGNLMAATATATATAFCPVLMSLVAWRHNYNLT